MKKQILAAETLVVVEDLYRPYRPKRRTRATIAKEKGLEPLANIIMLQMTNKTFEEEAKQYIVSEEKEVETVGRAINGAKDIIAETFPMRRIIESGSVRDDGKRNSCSAGKRPRRSSLFMRCIMNLKSR